MAPAMVTARATRPSTSTSYQHQYQMQDQAQVADGAMHRQGPMGNAGNG